MHIRDHNNKTYEARDENSDGMMQAHLKRRLSRARAHAYKIISLIAVSVTYPILLCYFSSFSTKREIIQTQDEVTTNRSRMSLLGPVSSRARELAARRYSAVLISDTAVINLREAKGKRETTRLCRL